MANNYTYISTTQNGVELHIIKTYAANIWLRTFSEVKNFEDYPALYGVNGGWFENKKNNTTLNVAMFNGSYVCADDTTDPIMDGSSNCVGEHVIGYLGTAQDTLFYQKVIHAEEDMIQLGGFGSGSWAQGGVAMTLGASNWRDYVGATFASEYLPAGSPGRTAMVVNLNTNDVYLIVKQSSPGVTPATFRSAIQSYFNITDGNSPHPYFKGLFLDGGGSSQMNCAEKKINGDGRALVQAIQLQVNS